MRNTSTGQDLGELGENCVAQWWQSQGALILHRRWHCRWGEIDLIVGQPAIAPSHPNPSPTPPDFTLTSLALTSLAFVEVKTRSSGNWDADGALALSVPKRRKLWKTAQIFLAQHPQWAELPCQFDVALVTGRRLPRGQSIPVMELPGDRHSLIAAGYHLSLQNYLPAAFTL